MSFTDHPPSNAGVSRRSSGTAARASSNSAHARASFAVSSSFVGIVRGSDPALRGQYVAMGAHNDHVGFTATPVDHDSARTVATRALVMSREVYTCGPADTLDGAEAVMRQRRVRRLPVVDASGRLVGVLTESDFARIVAGLRQPVRLV